MPVSVLDTFGHPACRNDRLRLDNHRNAVSLSIAFPNFLMFYKYRQLAPSADWAVLLVSPPLLWEKDCAFYPRNAADARMNCLSPHDLKTAAALSALFDTTEERAPWLRACDPTDPQAEVLVFDTVESRRIEAVAFETEEARNRHRQVLRGLESFVTGTEKGLFASRRRMLEN